MFFQQNRQRLEKLRTYRKVRSQLELLTDGDLADIGLKRYQLGHVARVKALGNG